MKIATEQLRLLNRATLIPLLLVCSLAIALVISQNLISRTDHLIKQTDEVIKRARRTQLLLLVMESNYNSYVVTRREEFLKGYQVARNELPENFFHLSDLVLASGGLHELQGLDSALGQWIIHSESLFGKPIPEAIKTFESAEFQRVGHLYLNGLRNAFENIVSEQMKLRDEQISKASRTKDHFLLFGVGLLLSVAIFLSLYFRKQLKWAFLKYETQTRRLRQSRNELQQSLSSRDQALRSRDEFIKIASHELNTPLQSLKLQTQMIQREALKPTPLPPEKLTRYFDRTDVQINRLAVLVKEMLEITQLGKGSIEIKRDLVKLEDLTFEVVEKLSPLVQASGSLLKVQINSKIEGLWDQARMEQILFNLISNSLKYGLGKPIVILASEQKGWVTLEIEDQGMGIPAEAKKRIFDRYERNISSHEVSGMGLGLFITRELVLAHGGKIRVESGGPNLGSTFIIELPLSLDSVQVPPDSLQDTLSTLALVTSGTDPELCP